MMIDNPGGFPTVILAHGSGSPMDCHFLNLVAEGLAEAGAEVIRFEFPYMAKRRAGLDAPVPDSTEVLMNVWRDIVSNYDPETIFIGGKSLGGRIASMLADELGVRGLFCLGYPFHPAERPEELRTAHLEHMETPTLILQGSHDRFGTFDEVADYELAPAVDVQWLHAADHSFVPTSRSGRSEDQHLRAAVDELIRFMNETPERKVLAKSTPTREGVLDACPA